MTIDTAAPGATVTATTPRTGRTPPSTRDGYIDAWRAAALARVVVYHATGFGWMTIVFPAMGLMFALAGSLTARSLDRGSPVVRARLRRLLPALWVFGAVAVPLTVWPGWGPQLAEPAERWGLLWWLIPLHAPPVGGASYAWAFSGILWYLAAYVWFVLLSPALLRLFRAWPGRTVAVALALPTLLHLDIISIGGTLEYPLRDLATYGACWVLGFAHHDGWLRKVPVRRFALAVAAAVVVAIVVFFRDAPAAGTADLNHLPLANTWWSAAFVAVVLRGHITRARAPTWLHRLTWTMNARAVTVYLWHFACLFVAREIAARLGDPLWTERLPVLVIQVGLVVVVAAGVGWVEDVAAGRPPQLLPRRTWPPPPVDDPGPRRPLGPRLVAVAAAGCAVLAAATFFERWPPAVMPTVSEERQPVHTVERFVTELPYTVVTNGLGPAERDRSNGGADVDDGAPIAIAGTTYEHGLGVRAPSRIRVYLDQTCSRFSATVGLDWSTRGVGSVRFQVLADGGTVYDSGPITRRREQREVDLVVIGVTHLDLLVTDNGDGTDGDAANWADPRALCAA